MSKLRDGGIQCYLKDEYTITVDPFLNNAIGGIKLVINKTDEQEVLQLLQKFDEDYRRNAVCPKCGSHNIELVPKRTATNMITAILSWLFSDYAVSAENIYKCGTCGYESKTLPEPFQKDASLLKTEDMN